MESPISLQVNPFADKRIPSWSLDSYGKDIKVLNVETEILLDLIKLMNEEEEETCTFLNGIFPRKVQVEIQSQAPR